MLDSGKIRVGVLRGGTSPEYQVSLETGRHVLDNLSGEMYKPIDIFISRDGAWHEGGLERSPESILRKVDVAFNALHGSYGEDGKLQQLLDELGVAYTGSGALSSAIGMNKISSKKIYRDNGLKIPYSISIPFDSLSREVIKEAFETVPMPFVVKPSSAGSSVGVRVAYSLPELEEAIIAAFDYSPDVIIEEYISGKEATCGVVDDFRGLPHYTLLPIEIRPKGRDSFFDYSSKYSNDPFESAEEICPGNFTREEKEMIEQMALLAHKYLGLRHYSRSDFRVHPRRGVFILETNTLPGLTSASLIPKSLHAAGIKISDFLHHIVSLALNKK